MNRISASQTVLRFTAIFFYRLCKRQSAVEKSCRTTVEWKHTALTGSDGTNSMKYAYAGREQFAGISGACAYTCSNMIMWSITTCPFHMQGSHHACKECIKVCVLCMYACLVRQLSAEKVKQQCLRQNRGAALLSSKGQLTVHQGCVIACLWITAHCAPAC